jgi:hypothetical protein
VSESKTPIDRALDVFVFAPLGLAMEMQEVVPRLAERGRQRLTAQVALAKMVGHFAVKQGQKEASKAAGKAVRNLGEQTSRLRRPAVESPAWTPPARPAATTTNGNGASSPSAGSPSAVSPAAAATVAAETAVIDVRTDVPSATHTAPPMSPAPVAPDASDLAIPGYDTLAASQVVPRLAGLSPAELEAVRAHELAGRGRKTILHRIDQLAQTS